MAVPLVVWFWPSPLSTGIERKKYFIKINIISPVSEVVARENLYGKKERLMVMGKIQKLCLYVAVAV